MSKFIQVEDLVEPLSPPKLLYFDEEEIEENDFAETREKNFKVETVESRKPERTCNFNIFFFNF